MPERENESGVYEISGSFDSDQITAGSSTSQTVRLTGSTSDWHSGHSRPETYRERVLRDYPNSEAPLLGILSRLQQPEEGEEDPQFRWHEQTPTEVARAEAQERANREQRPIRFYCTPGDPTMAFRMEDGEIPETSLETQTETVYPQRVRPDDEFQYNPTHITADDLRGAGERAARSYQEFFAPIFRSNSSRVDGVQGKAKRIEPIRRALPG
jgi:hypothetical protein